MLEKLYFIFSWYILLHSLFWAATQETSFKFNTALKKQNKKTKNKTKKLPASKPAHYWVPSQINSNGPFPLKK